MALRVAVRWPLMLLGLSLLASSACADGGVTVQLEAFGLHGVRVRVAPKGMPLVELTEPALLPEAPPGTPKVSPSASALTSGNLRVTADATGLVTATRLSDGVVVLQQKVLAFAAPSAPAVASDKRTVTVSFAGHGSDERIYGLGEHRTGRVNQMPYEQDFSHSQLYSDSHGGDVSIPWYCSSLGYGFVWNSPAFGNVSLNGDSLTWVSWASANADFWITVPPANSTNVLADLLHNYVDAVGHASRMPFDATGFIQCKNRYRNQTQLLDVARGYVDRGLPISIIVIDYFHWINQGDWAFNPACWPDPQGMVDELERLGIHLMVTFWPFQEPGDAHWPQFNNSGYLVPKIDGTLAPFDGSYYLYDAFNPDARNATFQGFMAGYGRYGIRRIWLDAAEPERIGSNPSQTVGQWRFSAGTDVEVGEAWVRNHARTFTEGMATIGVGPDDYFVLPRSAWIGSWRYSAGLWSGDIPSTFDELSIQVRNAQGVAMSGIVLWTTDIGGYSGGDPNDPVFQDLIVRWFQFGAFCPLFRLHGNREGGPPADSCGNTGGDNEVWNLAKDSAHYDGIATVMRLRENLRSYVQDINAEAAATGMPMLRPLVLVFPSDPVCATAAVEDQFMFGPDWLVAPVLGQVTERSVYLPRLNASEVWVYFFNETDMGAGGANLTMSTPINEFPLFYRKSIPQAIAGNATLLYNSDRQDTVLCISPTCTTDNLPPLYVPMQVEAQAWITPGTVSIGDSLYPLVPLTLRFSYVHQDNFVATNSTGPDSTYVNVFNDGFVLAEAAPGTVPLQVWRSSNGSHWATVASAAGRAWAQKNQYTFSYVTGYVLPA